MTDPSARQLLLLRHGRTPWNAIERAQGHTDVELDECGREQSLAAARVVALYAPARLWCSDLARARQTAAYVEEATGLTATADPRLREYDVGVRAGLTTSEFAERYPEEYAAWRDGTGARLVPGEEPTASVQARMAEVLEECFEALTPGETGVVVAHGAAMKVGIFALLAWDWSRHRAIKGMDNGGWAVLERTDRHSFTRLTAYNLLPRRRGNQPDFASCEGVG